MKHTGLIGATIMAEGGDKTSSVLEDRKIDLQGLIMNFKFLVLKTTIIFCAVYSQYSIACSFDTQCPIGYECKKTAGLYGYCDNGRDPGNTLKKKAPTDQGAGSGQSCSWDADCYPGFSCAKSGLEGMCLRN